MAKSKCCKRSKGYYEIDSMEYVGPGNDWKYWYKVTVRCPLCGKTFSGEIGRPQKFLLRLDVTDEGIGKK